MCVWQAMRRAAAAGLAGAAVALGLSAMSGPAAAQETIACVSKKLGLMRIVEDGSQCRSWEEVTTLGGDSRGVRFVFATSEIYDGSIPSPSCVSEGNIDCDSPLDRADFECNRLAGDANLPGDYVAWLSTATVDARDRLPADGGPWFNVKGEHVAPTRPFLTNTDVTELYNVIRYDETGADQGGHTAWTGTGIDGTRATIHCSSWTSFSCGDNGLEGQIGSTNFMWSNYMPAMCCFPNAIYCFSR